MPRTTDTARTQIVVLLSAMLTKAIFQLNAFAELDWILEAAAGDEAASLCFLVGSVLFGE